MGLNHVYIIPADHQDLIIGFWKCTETATMKTRKTGYFTLFVWIYHLGHHGSDDWRWDATETSYKGN